LSGFFGVIILIDCDNQPVSQSNRLFNAIQQKIGIVSCAFLVGNSHGEHVKTWGLNTRKKFPSAIIDITVATNRKESADANLIMKMAYVKALFSIDSVCCIVVTEDNQIIAAAEILADDNLKEKRRVYITNLRNGNVKTSLPLLNC